MRFNTRCIYCGRSLNSRNYCCPYHVKSWFHRYRTSDIKIDMDDKKTVVQSTYNNYSLDNALGLLQYSLLPHRLYMANATKTVGITPMHKLSNLNCGNSCEVYLKDEGQNPSGCFKDRESMMCKLNFDAHNCSNVVIYSSGNAAASAALILERSDAHLITFVPGDTYPDKIEYIKNHGSDLVIIGDENTSFEQGYRLFSDLNAANIFVERGFDNWSVNNPYRVQGDKTIAIEIIKQLSANAGSTTVPDYVVVPTANGSCLSGIWKGFKELYEGDVIRSLPKMVSTGIKNASPVCKAVQQNQLDKPTRCNLSKVDEQDADIGSIILAEEGYDSIQAAVAIKDSNGIAVELHAVDIQKTLIQFLKEEGTRALKHAILPEPASLTALAAVKKLPTTHVTAPNIVVVISTGHACKARDKIESLLIDKPQLHKIANAIITRRASTMKTTPTKKGIKVPSHSNPASVLNAFLKLRKRCHHEPAIQPV